MKVGHSQLPMKHQQAPAKFLNLSCTLQRMHSFFRHICRCAMCAGEQVPTLEHWQADGLPAAAEQIQQSLLDDMNTPQAMAAVSEPLKVLNDMLFTKKGRKVRDLEQSICLLQADRQRKPQGVQVPVPRNTCAEVPSSGASLLRNMPNA